jgi:coproporphyrinogen III oxidase-like Fe-S oxidoreductase
MPNYPPISIYINWPFKSEFTEEGLAESYLKALKSFEQTLVGKRLKSIYFGGGYTSLTPIKMTEKILLGINERININDDTEVTIEVNPALTTQQKLKDLKELGITRTSIASKSLGEALGTIELVSRIFDNYSFDLLYARPSQTLASWQEELKKAAHYIRHHISLHQHITSRSDLEAEMFKANMEILGAHGIHQYEISNYAIKGWESAHNLAYYNYDEYLGIGPGARSRIMNNKGVLAISIEKRPDIWLKKLANNLPTTTEKEELSPKQIAYEYIMMNLRKSSGLNEHDFFTKFGRDIHEYLDKDRLNSFQTKGWLHYSKERITVTEAGRIFLDKIILDVC